MTYSLGTKSRQNLARVRPRLVRVVELAIVLTMQDFCVLDSGGARTAEEQNALFKKGVTQKDGYKKLSNHQVKADGYGDAVDLVPWVDGKPMYDDTWARHYPVAVAMSLASRQLHTPIIWGGNWYESMDLYPATLEGVKEAVERYKIKHPGPDFIDAPHFQLAP